MNSWKARIAHRMRAKNIHVTACYESNKFISPLIGSYLTTTSAGKFLQPLEICSTFIPCETLTFLIFKVLYKLLMIEWFLNAYGYKMIAFEGLCTPWSYSIKILYLWYITNICYIYLLSASNIKNINNKFIFKKLTYKNRLGAPL